ncbi:acyl-CoA thioester hydrolase [Polaromonas sp. OV174]|uniref:tol-pal system-associated acyl-CoA thioesterase n=1 Tax=Polaromonas sp. OV174 TaxID=1855300 RepID=UPI0008EB6173|nr:tol-pal system-associated acyl-CoA thioesterase [Polaromonas sp. OV174]SFC11582.1 acyl-CoA thioester hydrolase [Polaromonas sp. OV174]
MSATVSPEPIDQLNQTQPERIFQWPIRIYWEDTDAGGIVFYANYLKFFERARTEWLRSLGLEQQQLKNSSGGMFVVSETSIRYHRPARLDDQLTVTASLMEIGRASMIIKQQALLKTEQSKLSDRALGKGPFPAEPPQETLAPSGASALREANSVGATLLCEGTIRIGWVNAASLQPMRIPAAILDCFKT